MARPRRSYVDEANAASTAEAARVATQNGRGRNAAAPVNRLKARPAGDATAELGEVIRGLKPTGKAQSEQIKVAPLRQAIITIPLIGLSPLKILRFSRKKQFELGEAQKAGSQHGSKKKRDPKDFNSDYEEAKYICTQDGKKWLGLNATGIRNGCIETCRMAGFVMTRAKMSIFCEADGVDDLDATPLCRIEGKEECSIDPVRNANGNSDLRARVMFRKWKLKVRIRFDEDQFSPSDILNLMIRVGQQNGLGEGRPNSTNGNGTGCGLFSVDLDNCTLERLPTAEAAMPDLD